MSIDMTTVKEITHNNKEVVKIEDSNGNILWQKNVPQVLTDTISITIGAGKNITTTQHYAYITIPTKNTIKNYIANSTGRNVQNLTNFKVSGLKAMRRGYTTPATYIRYFLINGSTTSGTVIESGIRVYNIGSSGQANQSSMMFTTTTSGITSAQVDITSYMPSSNTTSKKLYGAVSSASSNNPSTTTPTRMFDGDAATNVEKFTDAAVGTNSFVLPTFTLIVEYEYYE